jgi:hypothetical protein
MAAGYSKRTLVEKLGIKPGARIIILHAPDDYAQTLGSLPGGTQVVSRLKAPLDFIQFFTTKRRVLEREFRAMKSALLPNGTLWISWPKKAAEVETDLSENIVREIGLGQGMVDVKVCAVDETWSGLKFVIRLRDRPQQKSSS